MKKVWTVFLAIALCLTFCSCNSDEPNRRRKEQAASDTEGQYYLVKEAKTYLQYRVGEFKNDTWYFTDEVEWKVDEYITVEFDQTHMPTGFTEYRYFAEDDSYGATDSYEISYEADGCITITQDQFHDGMCMYGNEKDDPVDGIYKFDEYGHEIFWYFIQPSAGSLGDEVLEEHEYKYDEKGNIIEEIYFRDGEVSSKTWCDYNQKGQLITHKAEQWRAGEKSGCSSWEYQYAGNNVKVYYTDEDKGTSYLSAEYEHNEEGIVVRGCFYHPNGAPSFVGTQECDSNGRVSCYEYIFHRPGGAITSEGFFEYEYDKKGRLIKISAYGENGELYSYTEISYYETPVNLTQGQVEVFRWEGYPMTLLTDYYIEDNFGVYGA